MLAIDLLLTPITPDNPCGADLAFAPEVDEIARRGQELATPRCNLLPDLRQHDLARTPLDELRRQLLLKLPDLHRKGGLGDGTCLRRPAKMPMFRQCGQIPQLLQRNHGDKIILLDRSGNTIRPDP